MLKIEDISKKLGKFLLKNISLEVDSGDYFVLLGSSGVGKTVLLEIVAGFIRPDEGKVFLNGEDITSKGIQERALGLVPQDHSLFPHFDVFDNIAYGLHAKGWNRKRIREKVESLAYEVGAASLLNRYPKTLSGGETQRVTLARTLANDPKCLLLDEPFSSLDVQSGRDLRYLLRKLHRKGRTILHITHDYEEAISLATRIGVMEEGRISQVDTPLEVFRHPRSEFVARFIGIRNFIKGELRKNPDCEAEGVFRLSNGAEISVLTGEEAGRGFLMIRSEDIVISNTPFQTSARNAFRGIITDIAPAHLGVEVIVNIGTELAALITRASVKNLGLECGKEVWLSFKASAAKFYRE